MGVTGLSQEKIQHKFNMPVPLSTTTSTTTETSITTGTSTTTTGENTADVYHLAYVS
jgi:hypothetical protein